MTLSLWLLVPLCVCALVGVGAVVVVLVVLAALGASRRPDQIGPLLDDGSDDDSGLLISGPWNTRDESEGSR